MKSIKQYFNLFLVLALVMVGCKDNSDFPDVRNEALTNLQRGGSEVTLFYNNPLLNNVT